MLKILLKPWLIRSFPSGRKHYKLPFGIVLIPRDQLEYFERSNLWPKYRKLYIIE